MTDRRRTNPPNGGTAPPIFLSSLSTADSLQSKRPSRTRRPDEIRKIFLKTGLNPSATGSAYLELPLPTPPPLPSSTFLPASSSLKLTCSIHGPHPLPRSQPYSPHLQLSTHIKFAPFASRVRRGYVRDAQERDLAAHLDTALRGVVIGERWPKSGVDVCVTVLEGEEDAWWGGSNVLQGDNSGVRGEGADGGGNWGAMTVLAGCVTVASAAMVDAGIDCVDLVSGGVAAVVEDSTAWNEGNGKGMVLDPSPPEHERVVAAAMVAYLQSRDEITELWVKGDAGIDIEDLINGAVHAASGSRTVLAEELREAGERKFGEVAKSGSEKVLGTRPGVSNDVDMTG
ncbi:hypothetical protein EV356DRAFT_454444 [Viridothelium virens]|uniref:Exoribonuclease phosphorolytic domain-containing protein n=1 Tax=Viridothelium virens TaxID=1048519 RepID=A0A6A6GXS2_VIRVR|nr:hypothetical protein EV356DRAFT_454444 [Viridothelium virens]